MEVLRARHFESSGSKISKYLAIQARLMEVYAFCCEKGDAELKEEVSLAMNQSMVSILDGFQEEVRSGVDTFVEKVVSGR